MEKLFRQSPNVGLIAENGGFIRAPGAKKKWLALAKNCDFSWREHVEQIFNYYQERTPGSSVYTFKSTLIQIEEKETSLIFHYEDADQKDAERQARECANHINDSCPPTVHAVLGEFFVVAEPTAFTKATACAHLYSTLATPPSFLFVAGNDRTDEDVFKWANALEKDGKVKSVVTVSVGARRTEARSFVTGTQAILTTLRVLASRGGGGLKVVGKSQGNVLAGRT
jgi:trehalose 6-phosphate synthase/phosphatase